MCFLRKNREKGKVFFFDQASALTSCSLHAALSHTHVKHQQRGYPTERDVSGDQRLPAKGKIRTSSVKHQRIGIPSSSSSLSRPHDERTTPDAMLALNPRRDTRHVLRKSCLLRLPRRSGSCLRHSPRVLSRSTCLSACKSLDP